MRTFLVLENLLEKKNKIAETCEAKSFHASVRVHIIGMPGSVAAVCSEDDVTASRVVGPSSSVSSVS